MGDHRSGATTYTRCDRARAFHPYSLGRSLARVGDHLGVDHATVSLPGTPTGDPASKQAEPR